MDEYQHPLATPQHRLGGLAVDVALFIFTLGIGWFIWLLVVMGQGQSPGKQILKLRVYDSTTGHPARWGHMFIRELGLESAISILFTILSYLYLYIFDFDTESIATVLILILSTVDGFWIFKNGDRRRLVDIILKTDVLNESPIR